MTTSCTPSTRVYGCATCGPDVGDTCYDLRSGERGRGLVPLAWDDGAHVGSVEVLHQDPYPYSDMVLLRHRILFATGGADISPQK